MLSVIGVRAIAMFQLGFGEIRLYRRIFACLSRQNIKYLYFHLKKEQVSGQKKLISFFIVCADKINIIIFYFWWKSQFLQIQVGAATMMFNI